MISYQTQATREAANAIAEKHTGHKLVGSGVDGKDRASVAGKRTEALATAHSEALARRNAG